MIAAGAGGFLAMRMGTPARGAEIPQTTPASAPASALNEAAPAPQASPVPIVESTGPVPIQKSRPAMARPSAPATADRQAASLPPAAPASAPTSDTGAQATPTPVAPPTSDTSAQPPVNQAPPPPQEPPKPRFDELTVPQNSVIGIRLDAMVTSDTAKVEDKIAAHVTRDLMVAGRTAIPAGSKVEGNVTFVDRGGKFKQPARLGIKFTTLVLPDNTRLPIQTEAIFRDGESPGNESAAKVGASAAVGAILGAVIGGKKGAAIGTAAGAAGGTAAVAAGGRNDAVFASGSALTVRLTSPVTVMIERQQSAVPNPWSWVLTPWF